MKSNLGMSFLDVLCSALGATVVLTVIFAVSEIPTSAGTRVEFMLIRVQAVADVTASESSIPWKAPELGVHLTDPDLASFTCSDAALVGVDKKYKSATKLEGRGGARHAGQQVHIEYWVRIEGAARGNWRIKPFLKSGGSSNIASVDLLRIDVWDAASGPPSPLTNANGVTLRLSDLAGNENGIVIFEAR